MGEAPIDTKQEQPTENGTSSTGTNVADVGRRFDQLSRGAIFIFGSLYAAGLLIVNSNLGRYGLFHAELARPEYVMAGTMWAFLTLATVISIRVMTDVKKYLDRKPKWLGLLLAVGFFVVIPINYFLVLRVASLGQLYILNEADWTINWEGVVAVIALGFNAGLTWSVREISRSWDLAKDPTSIFNMHHWNIVYHLAMCLAALFAYGTLVYPLVPRQFGGGSKPFVRIYLSEQLSTAEFKDDLPISSDGRSVGPVRLIFETDSMLFIKGDSYQTLFGALSGSGREKQVIGIDASKILTLKYVTR